MLFTLANMERMKGVVAVFIGAISFGILSTFVKKAYAAGYSLAEVTGIQAFLGMLFLWFLYFLSQLSGSKKKYTKQTKIWKLIVAGFSTGTVSILYYKCVGLVSASIAIVLLMQYIWISALLNFLVYKQAPSKREYVGIGIILIATLLATGVFQASFRDVNLWGIAFGLLAALAYAIFIIVNGKVGNDYPPLLKSAYMITGACLLIAVLLQPIRIVQLPFDTNMYQFGLLLSIFGTVLPPLLFAYGMPKTGISLGSILSAVELPVAVAMSFYVLQENVSSLQWAGVLLILVTVVWLNRFKTQSLKQ